MQTQLVLNDIRPRPRLYSTSVITGAVEAFLLENELSMILSDFSAGDEEWLRELFSYAVTTTTASDAWTMATSFAEEMHEAVCEDYVDIFERFVSHLSKYQEDVLRDWISSGGATNPLASGDLFRVEIETKDGSVSGIAFNDARRAETGKFAFVADDNLHNSISSDGNITTLRILEWEMIRSISEPTEGDREIHRRDTENRIKREQQTADRLARSQAERDRNAILAANAVTDDEAARIYSSLAMDEATAARTANAIIATLTASALKKLQPAHAA